MDQVKKASLSELRHHFSVVEQLLRDGEEVQITKRNCVIARLLPPEPVVAVEMPDFLGRMKKIFGKKRMKMSGAEQIALDCSERF
jgi:antitoxin (DNA-binding transcriptional repressor) of toxin-antitoxin stability system